MKKTFRSILAGALALLTVSCYDDSALRESIVKLDERVTAIENTLNADVNGINDLAARLAAAETALAATNASLTSAQASIADILKELDAFDGQVDGLVKDFQAAIKALQDSDTKLAGDFAAADAALVEQIAAAVAKVAVVKVEEVKGNVVLTLADGSTVSLSKPLANVENSGLVTVVDGMWAVVKQDGTTESLNVPVGHPDAVIKFQVASNGDLQYSVNGGEWMNTGVNTADVSGSAYVINGVVPAEDKSFVTITIGETEYALPMYVPAVFEISRESMYVGYGLSKTFTVNAEGVESFYVAAKPDGWKVTVEGNVVTVYAPSQAVADLGVAEAEGEIVLHADANGCAYASLKVTTGPAFSIEIDSKSGDVKFFNALTIEYPDYTGMFGPTYDFAGAQVGILSLSDFQGFESVAELIQYAEEGYLPSGYLENIKWNAEVETFYQPGVYEEDSFSINIATLGASFWPPVELEEGVSYVVWALPQTDKVLKDQFTYAFYKPLKVQPEATAVSFNDITVNLTASGATGYYANLFEAEMFSGEYGMPLDEFLENGYGFGGVWKQFMQSGMPEAFGTEIVPGEPFNLSSLNFGDPLNPMTKYILVVFPYDATKTEFTLADDVLPYVYEFTTTGISAGAPEATLEYNEAESDYKTIAVDLTSPEGCVTYYKFVDAGSMDDYNDEELANYLLKNSYYSVAGAETVTEDYLTPGVKELCKTKELVAVTLTADGKYSISRGLFSTISLPVVDNITMTLASMTKDADNNVTAIFNVTGATKVAVYPYYNASQPAAFRLNIISGGVAGNYSGMTFADVVDGKATVTFKTSNDNLFYSAYNVEAEAVSSLMAPGYLKISTSLTE